MFESWLIRFLLSVVSLIVVGYAYSFHQWRKYKFPPSPPGQLPIIGHAHLLPKTFAGDKTKEWAEQLGSEMMYLRLGGVDWVFLNSSRVVEDLLERRSAIYSGRPSFGMVGGLISKHKRLVLQTYTQEWRDLRRVHHQLLTGTAAETYKPMEELESRQSMWEILHDPDKWYLETIRMSASFTLGMVYGIRQQGQSELFDAVSNAQDEFLRNNTPGMWLIDGYPQLGNLPKFLQWWRPYGEKVYNQTRDAFRAYYDLMLDNIAKGVQKDCFATKFYSEADSKYPQFDFDQRLFTTGGIVEAGSDTSKNQLNMLFAAMAKNDDDWVAKARNELDQVCGNNAERLPQFSDWEHLPYLQAIIKETMRWRPNVSPTGFPHALMQDDEYEGYKFPAGTVFTINNWALSLSSKEYEEPEKFKPERFMNKDLFNPLKGHYGYGAGRRACAGYKVAHNTMFIFFSRLIYCFDVKEDPHQPIDTYHIPLTPPPGHGTDQPFKVYVTPRSEEHSRLILCDCAGAEKEEFS